MADNFDNYSMKVQARVDLPSNKDIDTQIRKLEKSISKLKVSGQFDDTALRNLTNQLNTLKANITTANFSPTALTELTNQVNRALQNINIGNINVGGVGNQAQQVGQQIGQQINQGVSQSLSGNTGVLDTFRRSLENIGMGSEEIDAVANRIENLGVKIEALNQSTSHTVGRRGNRDILSVDISGTDRLGQAIKLTEQYNVATGDLIRSMDSVSTAQQKAGSSTNTFAKQQSQAVTNLTNQINQLNRAANDQNKARPITDSTHLDRLSTAYNEIISAIQRMGNASSDTFVTEQNNVKTLISNYKSLVSEFRNAENVSTKMKGTDFASGLAIARNDLEKFKADAKDFPQIIQTINNLDTAISSVGDASSLNKFNDDLRVARSELAKIKSETSATNRNEKVGINVSGLQSQIADLQRISPEIDKFEANINGAKVTVQSLLTDLANVNTQSDFSVINSKWKAFTDSAKSAGIAITEVATKSDSLTEKVNKIQLSMSTGGYESKIDSLIGKTQQWVDANGNARISTDALQTAMNNLNTAYANITATGGNTVANQQALIEAERALDTEVKKVQSSVTSMNATMAKSTAVDSLRQKVQMFYDTNTKSHRTYGAQLRAIVSELATGAEVPITRLRQIQQEFIGIQNSARQAGKLGLSFFDTVKQGMKSFSYWTSSTFLVMKAIQEVRQVITNVKELDNAMMDLTMATGYNKNQVEELMDTYFKLGEELSATATDVAASADTWLRQGKSIAETNELIKDSMILSKISGLSAEESTKYLTSAMKGYKVATEDVLGVVDKLSAVDMASATDVGGLAEGMSEVAASADLAGVSMDKLLGYLAIVGETTQSGMSEVGTSFNAIFARMGNIKLARLKDYQNNGEDLSNVETVLRGEGIVLRDSVNEFRNFGEVLDEVAGRWTSFSEVSQRAIASAFAG